MEANWRPRGRSAEEYTAEQDRAAGGRSRRRVATSDARAPHASVALKQQSNRVYAYLRYQLGGKTWTKYIGGVGGAQDREDALRIAWRKAHQKRLLRHGPAR